MVKIKCLIVDDEPLALDVLQNHIANLEYLELVGRCKNAIEALKFLLKHKVDLLFLDIQMPKLTGIEFLKSIKNPPKVIFTTAYREFALEGYELNVLDYLLKPIAFERFLAAVNKALPKDIQSLPAFIGTDLHESANAFIYIKSDKKMVKALLNDILYIESLKDYVRVVTKDKEVITHQTMNFLEEKLPDNQFIRIHRSFIIALHHIHAYTVTDVEVGERQIPIGRVYKVGALKRLGLEKD